MKQAQQRREPRQHLIEARHARQWSQQQLAAALGTTHVNVSRWERSITKPNPYFRYKLCKLFGKTEAELDLTNEQCDLALPALQFLLNSGEVAHVILLPVEEYNRLRLKHIG
jgi:transcriptional regulator with XRE-family HTH domain